MVSHALSLLVFNFLVCSCSASLKQIVVYHVHPGNDTDVPVNMNTGDARGDVYFDERGVSLPWLCAEQPSNFNCKNPEQNGTDLVVAKVILEIDTNAIGLYARCNILPDGTYSCTCSPKKCNSTLGMDQIITRYANRKPHASTAHPWDYWKYNVAMKMGGLWWSTMAEGQCQGDKVVPGNCTWRVVDIPKRVKRSCLQSGLDKGVYTAGASCFQGCPQPQNSSSICYITCYYNTLLGPAAINSLLPPLSQSGNITAATLVELWEAPFASDDPTKGGCPTAPPPPNGNTVKDEVHLQDKASSFPFPTQL